MYDTTPIQTLLRGQRATSIALLITRDSLHINQSEYHFNIYASRHMRTLRIKQKQQDLSLKDKLVTHLAIVNDKLSVFHYRFS